MRLQEIMSTRVATVESTEPASAAWSRMRKNRIRHLVVTDRGALAGMISESDLGGRLGDETRSGRTVGELMSPRVVTAEPTMMLRKAANLMSGRVIGSLPVMDDGQLVGIVTATDVLDALGSGSTRPRRRPEPRTLRMTESRRRAARKPAVARRVSGSRTGRARSRKPDSPAKSAFPGWIPKTVKRQPAVEGTPIAAHIRAREGDLGPDDRAYIRRKLGRTLGKFSDSIERVSVRTEDVNGPRGGVDRVCRIKVVLSGMPSIVFESRDAALHAAVDGALTGVERSVRRAIQRRRMKPIRRAA